MTDLAEFIQDGIEIGEMQEIDPEKEDLLHLLDEFTINQWMPSWVRQSAENIGRIPKEPKTLKHLKNIHWGRDAAILASGPSLDNDLPHLKKFKGIIFAGNSTLNPCVANGVIPDWFMVLDADPQVTDQVREVDCKEIKALLPVYVYYSMAELFDPDLTWWFNVYDHRHWFMKHGLHFMYPAVDGLLASGCNPAGMIRMAYHMGIRKIYLLGGDCGFTGGRERCSIYHRQNGSWIKGTHDSYCVDKSQRDQTTKIETTLKLKVAHATITQIATGLPGLQMFDCSQGLLTAFPKINFAEVVNGRSGNTD